MKRFFILPSKKSFKKENFVLTEIDNLYSDVISKLDITTRKQYCINLIGRTKHDLKIEKNKQEKVKLNSLIKASKNEINSLHNLIVKK